MTADGSESLELAEVQQTYQPYRSTGREVFPPLVLESELDLGQTLTRFR
jgi:hypothetical protein